MSLARYQLIHINCCYTEKIVLRRHIFYGIIIIAIIFYYCCRSELRRKSILDVCDVIWLFIVLSCSLNSDMRSFWKSRAHFLFHEEIDMCWKSRRRIECDGLECVAAPLRATELCSKLSLADQARVEGNGYVRNLHARNVVEKRCTR